MAFDPKLTYSENNTFFFLKKVEADKPQIKPGAGRGGAGGGA